ncbi:MAG: glucose/arabinose dehydrogenase, partial [Verrucomicrobiales bacterium]
MRILIFVLLLSVALPVAAIERVENTTIQMPAEMPVSGFGLVEAFGAVRFDEPVAIASPPGDTGRVFVAERRGRIKVVDFSQGAPQASVFLDMSNQVRSSGLESGLLGLVFHPDYAENGYFYIFRTSIEASDAAPNFLHDVIARYTVSDGDPNVADPGSELLIVTQLDDSPEHNAGDLHFGPDGYLYFTIGDNGPGEVDASLNPQPIDKGLFGGLFRIDVDFREGSIAANDHHSSRGNYAIPADNPFIGVTEFQGETLDPTKVRTEFYALGFRNPFRFSFRPVTGEIYLGDVGVSVWEEINIVQKGANYGWPYSVGPRHTGVSGPGRTETVIPPEILIPHGRTTYLGNSIIGGIFYTGSNIPALAGAYVYGDHRSGHLWVHWPGVGSGGGPQNWLANKFGISCFGRDPSNGDILVGNVATGEVDRLVYVDPVAADPFPQTLSETGLFSDLATLEPNPGVVAYEINHRFWSDHADKRRWFSVPELEDNITVQRRANWTFPAGSVWVKHFDLEMVRGDPSSSRRLETRVLVKRERGVYGVTYRWDPVTGEALLVPPEG